MSDPDEPALRQLDATPDQRKALQLQLDKLLVSPLFTSSPRMRAFLEYTFQNTLTRDLQSLKECCIGVAVFDRDPSYDPREDGIVRVEARRLRTKLEAYYAEMGSADPWLISMPKGGYRLHFEERPREAPGSPPQPDHLVTSSGTCADTGGIDPRALHPHPREAEWMAPPAHPSALEARYGMPVSVTGSWQNRLGLHVASVVAVTLLALAALFVFKPSHTSAAGLQSVDGRVQYLTTYLGQEIQPTLSPDGHTLAFVWDGDRGEYNLYTRGLAGGEPRQITFGTEHHLHPSWSPDGRDLAYVRVSRQRLEVVLLAAVGGAERSISTLMPQASPWHASALQVNGQWSAAWTPDGHSVISNVAASNNGDRTALVRIALDGTASQQLTYPKAGQFDNSPAVSPDGHLLAFDRATSKLTGDVWLLDLRDRSLRQITHDQADVRGIAWTPDGEQMIFASQRTGAYQLWSVSPPTGQLTALHTQGSNLTDPEVTPDGKYVLFASSELSANVWQQALVNGHCQGRPTRLLTSSKMTQSARLSPDGSQLAFVSNRSGSWEIWSAAADGSAARQLTYFGGPLVDAPHWSPDGRQLVFEARPAGRSALFTIHGDGSGLRQMTYGASENKMPVWSADGAWIYFNSDAGGTPNLWRIAPDGTQQARISDRTGWDLVEHSPYLYFLSSDEYLYRVPEQGGHAERLASLGAVGLSRYFGASSKALYFLADEQTPVIRRLDFASSRVETVTGLDQHILSSTPSLSLSTDDRRMLYTLQETSTSDIDMMPIRKRSADDLR